jgi:hypothetical protein
VKPRPGRASGQGGASAVVAAARRLQPLTASGMPWQNIDFILRYAELKPFRAQLFAPHLDQQSGDFRNESLLAE